MENKNVQILSIEGKDLLSKKYKVNKKTIYKGSLDDSIEIDELNKIGKKIIKYKEDKRRFYSNDVITVTFKYSCKEDSDLTDEEFERVENLKLTLRLLNLDLDLQNDNNKKIIKETKCLLDLAKKNINKKTIRQQLYQYGFNININGKTKHFVRYKRSSGSARVGKCLFINEKYYKHMIDWSFAGISHELNQNMDCASMESYISLPTSSCIGRFKLKPENILLIDDGAATFEDTVMATRLINEERDEDGNIINGDLDTNIEKTKITNKIWDGENLLCKSVFEEYGYNDKSILQIRNRFFKGIGINTDIQLFFKDNNITDISQLKGKTTAKDIKDIKLITTPSSVKYLKYGDYETWLKQIVEDWGICKYEKPQHHFNGMVQTHYQLINTLGMNKEKTREFLQDTIDYINLLKTDTSVFKYHLGIIKNQEDDEPTELSSNINSNCDFILAMLNINEDFIYTKMCKKFREEVVQSYINNVRKGHVLVEGNYSVVVSSPLEYLKASIGKWNGESLIKPNECVNSKFDIGDQILGVRSPQPTMCNMTVFRNNKYNELDRYFNTESKEVIYISAIGWNIFELESSMDVDGDQMLISNNKYIVDSALKLNEKIIIDGKEINRFLVSTDFTPKLSINRKYNWEDLSDTDIKCSSNKIGEIINLAQMLNSVYWDENSKNKSEEYLFELYKDICQLNILSCIEIDRCKKLSPVDATKELKKIRNKEYLKRALIKRDKKDKEVGVRPYFFKFLDGGKDYKFKKMNTGMDFLEIVLDEEIKRKIKYTNTKSLLDILVKSKVNKKERHSIEKIKKIAKELKYKQTKIWSGDYENKRDMSLEAYKDAFNKIRNVNITDSIIYTLISRIEKSYSSNDFEEYKKLGNRILRLIYNSNKDLLLKNIKIKNKKNSYLVETDNKIFDLQLYGLKFKKE